MKKKKKSKKLIIICLIILLIVLALVYFTNASKEVIENYSNSFVIENLVEKGNIEVKISESSVAEPLKRHEIYPTIEGEVKKVYFNQGDYVKKDAVLYKIGSTKIKTPVEGTLITNELKEGDYVSIMGEKASNPIAIIADISKLKMTLEIDELDITKVNKGMEVNILCDVFETEGFKGTVTNIASEGISLNGVTTYNVEVEITDPKNLKIGMNLDATIIIENKQDVLRVSIDAINKENNEIYVYVKDESYQGEQTELLEPPSSMSELKGYKKQVIKTGISNKDYIEVLEGLNENDKIYYIGNSKTLEEYMRTTNTMM